MIECSINPELPAPTEVAGGWTWRLQHLSLSAWWDICAVSKPCDCLSLFFVCVSDGDIEPDYKDYTPAELLRLNVPVPGPHNNTPGFKARTPRLQLGCRGCRKVTVRTRPNHKVEGWPQISWDRLEIRWQKNFSRSDHPYKNHIGKLIPWSKVW